MIITEIQYFFSKIIRFQAIFKDTVEFTCALEFKISSQQKVWGILKKLQDRGTKAKRQTINHENTQDIKQQKHRQETILAVLGQGSK